ncbi:hypothetical protein KKF84_06175 [Myxococcota bacterium]|nr:hypothetical protein [Myxococcota bacterium]MBU1534886.1 hypothetical protein [Myxococcota bacterium]
MHVFLMAVTLLSASPGGPVTGDPPTVGDRTKHKSALPVSDGSKKSKTPEPKKKKTIPQRPFSFISDYELNHTVTARPLQRGQTSMKIGFLTAGFSRGITNNLELGLTWYPPLFLYGFANAVIFKGEEAQESEETARLRMLQGLLPLGLHAKYAFYQGESFTVSANITLPLAELLATYHTDYASLTVSGFGTCLPTTDYSLGGARLGAALKGTRNVNFIFEGAIWYMAESTGFMGSFTVRLGSPGGVFVDLSVTGVMTRAHGDGHINQYLLPLLQLGNTF